MSETAHFAEPLALTRGGRLAEFDLAYETYGEMSARRDNVILVCHGLTTGPQAAGITADGRPGWWDIAIGPSRMLDTDRYCVLCVNVLGSCHGSTGPQSPHPEDGRPYGMRFPLLTIADMVDAQCRLLDLLGIERLAAVIGGCMGGFAALEWARRHPHRLARAIAISATPATSAYTIALWEVLRHAIYADPHWRGGDYYGYYGGSPPLTGVGLAAMIGSVLWLDRDTLAAKFGRHRAEGAAEASGFGPTGATPEFAVETFLERVRGNASLRFDPNSLIVLTRAVDLFDLAAGHADLGQAVAAIAAPVLLASYAGDWRYPAAEIEALAQAMRGVGVTVEHLALDAGIGHGAFQFDLSGLEPAVRRVLAEGISPP
jgi:homoserine O-acetyltransferase